MQNVLAYIACFVIMASYGQKQMDSLCCKPYPYYERLSVATHTEEALSTIYIRAWLRKAIQERNMEELSKAYRALTFFGTYDQKMENAVMMIGAAEASGKAELVASAYLTRGIVYYENRRHRLALDDYLKADSALSANPNPYLRHKIKYQIGFTKYYLGYYHEAISLLRQCVDYFAEENDRAYLNSLYALALCYSATGKYALCSALNKKGLEDARILEIPTMIPYFELSEGLNQYCLHNYDKSIELVKRSLEKLQPVDRDSQLLGWFYLASSYWDMEMKDASVPYLRKIASSFAETQYIRPQLLKTFFYLKSYYEGIGDVEEQLEYLDQLLKADSIVRRDYSYLLEKILRDYNVKELRDEKVALEAQRKAFSVSAYGAIAGLLATTVFFYVRQRRNRNRLKDFESLVKRISRQEESKPRQVKSGDIGLSPEVADTLLERLEMFEKNKKYLGRDMTLARMAEIMHTNQKYVTKVISHYRGKRTIDYINELKIAYITEKLISDPRFRRYTNKALADEAGFGSTQIFTKTFKKINNASPTWFIAQLEEQLE